MKTLSIIILVAFLSACASVPKAPQDAISRPIERPWSVAIEKCHVDTVSEVVTCAIKDFKRILDDAINVWETLEKTNNRLDAALKLGVVDKQVLEAQVFNLTTKLNSPWRSWWLWGIIGMAVGAALTTGLVFGVPK